MAGHHDRAGVTAHRQPDRTGPARPADPLGQRLVRAGLAVVQAATRTPDVRVEAPVTAHIESDIEFHSLASEITAQALGQPGHQSSDFLGIGEVAEDFASQRGDGATRQEHPPQAALGANDAHISRRGVDDAEPWIHAHLLSDPPSVNTRIVRSTRDAPRSNPAGRR